LNNKIFNRKKPENTCVDKEKLSELTKGKTVGRHIINKYGGSNVCGFCDNSVREA